MSTSKRRQVQKYFLGSIVIASAFFFGGIHAHASVVINEIMYDAEGADIDWIELYNDASSAQDITGWKFGDASSANHVINVPPANGGQGSMTIPAGGYAILTGDANAFLSAHSGFSDVVLDTTMSLTNTSSTISIRETSNGAAVDSVTYSSDQGASGDGNSLQLIDGDWTPGTPTPDAENSADTNNNDDDTDTTTLADTDDDSSVKNEIVAPRFTADIIAPKIIMSNTPTPFEAFVRQQDGTDIQSGTYIWNMGDGTSYEKKGNEEFTHTYLYTGDYAVHLEFFDKSRTVPYRPDDVDDLVVHVVTSNLVITTNTDGGIVISNKNSRDVVLDGFTIRAGTSAFVFPKHSVLLAGKSVTFAPARLGLPVSASVALVTPAGITESTYPNTIAKTSQKSSQVLSYREVTEINAQEALAIGATDTTTTTQETSPQERKKPRTLILWISIIGVIGIGICMYLFLGRPTTTEEGFSLLDE